MAERSGTRRSTYSICGAWQLESKRGSMNHGNQRVQVKRCILRVLGVGPLRQVRPCHKSCTPGSVLNEARKRARKEESTLWRPLRKTGPAQTHPRLCMLAKKMAEVVAWLGRAGACLRRIVPRIVPRSALHGSA
jgi:hypothetical protein